VVEATLYFKFYLFRALRKTGMADRYLDELGPWRRMLALGLTTFPETDGVPRSDCHPWSSTPCFDLLGTVAGISPAEPGFKKVDIAPAFGYLKRIEAQMPHPAGGLISVSLQKDDNGRISGSVTLPEEVRGVFRWNNKEYPLSPGLQKIAY